jgi:HD-GYP domain-containing protein (c-di-GMP phosphodiesterase class II)
MLSQVGCVTLPEGILEKVAKGAPLPPAEFTLFYNHPLVGHDLIANIPRLDGVAAIIKYQEKRFDGTGTPRDPVSGAAIPLGARMLKLALDLDALTSSGQTISAALGEIKSRLGWYDPKMVTAIAAKLDVAERYEVRTVNPVDLKPGMLFAADVLSTAGTLLVTKGQEVSFSLRLRLMNLDHNGALAGKIQVLIPESVTPA